MGELYQLQASSPVTSRVHLNILSHNRCYGLRPLLTALDSHKIDSQTDEQMDQRGRKESVQQSKSYLLEDYNIINLNCHVL